MDKILNKRQFYELWETGALGNKPYTWNSLDDAMGSGFEGPVAIRYSGNGGGGPLVLNLALAQFPEELEKLVQAGWKREDFTFTEQLTPGIVKYVINGELMRSHRGLELFYSTENQMMRDSLKSSGESVCGLRAIQVLRQHLGSSNCEELEALLDTWPDHVVEFSGFDRKVGIFQQKMIIWEVRKY